MIWVRRSVIAFPPFQSTSFEDSDDQRESEQKKTPTSNDLQMDRQTQTLKEEEEADTEDEEEYTDSEMEELADEVEQVRQKRLCHFCFGSSENDGLR